MRILLCNDDGVHAHGLKVLYKELRTLGQVTVVAPLEEKSTTGHSLTIHKPLRMIPMAKDFYGVSGSPADCVYIGIRQILKGMPDLVVSGINRGANLGQDVYYSGTVSAAREACILGLPAMAVSLAIDFAKVTPDTKLHYETAAKLAARLLRKWGYTKSRGKQHPSLVIPKHSLLNLNVPDVPIGKVKGIKLAHQGFRYYSGNILRRRDHRGKDYFWVGGAYKGFKRDDGTDCMAVDQGYAALTPLRLDCTHEDFLMDLRELAGGELIK